MKPALGIGLDLGTSGCRALVIDARQQRLGAAEVALPLPQRRGTGEVEQDPELWWDATLTVLRQLAETIDHGMIDAAGMAICVDATSATLLLSETDGTPLGPALMYDDSRSRAEAEYIAALAPAHSAARGPGSSLAKAMHLQAAYAAPSARSPTAPVLALHQADWVIGRLRGTFGDSDWNNALKLGFDPQASRGADGAWPDWVGELLPASVALPHVHAPGALLGPIAPAVANCTGLPSALRVCAGTTDSTAAVIATGAHRSGDAVTSLGSTLVLKVMAERPISAPDHGIYSHRLGDRWLVGGASNSGGAVLRQFFDDARIVQLSQRIDPRQSTGLDYYPLPAAGERFPIADPTLQPRLSPRPADDTAFLHGLFEGIAGIERDGYAYLTKLGAPRPERVLSTGGGARNPIWTEIRQHLLGVPVMAAEQQEAVYGAALLALKAGLRIGNPTGR